MMKHRQLILNVAAGHANFRSGAGPFSPQTARCATKREIGRPKTTTGFRCSMGKNSKKRGIQALRGPNMPRQMIDYIGVIWKFRYAAEQRNFGGRTEELNGLTAELQRKLSVRK